MAPTRCAAVFQSGQGMPEERAGRWMSRRSADYSSLRVSYHAVTRYVQRILNITVAGTWTGEKAKAAAHAKAAGMSIRAVRALIWTPGVEAAARLGFSSVSNGRFLASISQPDSVVATICSAPQRGPHRLRMLSDKELRTRSKRVGRKLKRRPSITDALMHGAGPDEE